MSEIRATTISNAAGTGPVALYKQSAAKAWVNFDGTGTVAIRISLNTSSITDNSSGNYTQNFASSFSNGHSTSGSVSQVNSFLETEKEYSYVNTSVGILSRHTGGSANDTAHMDVQNYGDLA
jgi:hypothetical protein